MHPTQPIVRQKVSQPTEVTKAATLSNRPDHKNLPDITPVLVVPDIEKALSYYKLLLDAQPTTLVMRAGKAVLGEMTVGDTVVMLRTPDATIGLNTPTDDATVAYLNYYLKDVDSLFRRVKDFATVAIALNNRITGDRWGMVRDRYGHHWGLGSFKVHLRDSQISQLKMASNFLSMAEQQTMIDEMWPVAFAIDEYRGSAVRDVSLTLYVGNVAKEERQVSPALVFTLTPKEVAGDGRLVRVILGRKNSAVTIHDALWDDVFRNNSDPLSAGGTSVALYCYVADMKLTLKRFRSKGGQVLTNPLTTSWGERVAHVRDISGHVWILSSR